MCGTFAWPERIFRLQGLSGSIYVAQGDLTQARGVEIFAGVFSCKFLGLFYKARK